MSNWTKIIFDEEKQVYQVMLAPDFADLSKTQFPNGLRLLGQNYKTDEEAILADAYLDKTFSEMEEGYAIEKEEDGFSSYEEHYRQKYTSDSDMSNYGVFVSAYTHFEGSTPYDYPRFIPHFVDLESVGFPHGISISEKQFFGKNSRKEIIEFMKEIDDFFFYILSEYEKQEVAKHE